MPKIIKKYATGDEVPMTIEELLEALPAVINIKERPYYFRIQRRHTNRWNVGYSVCEGRAYDKLVSISHNLKEALEGVYNDLVSNKLL